MQDPIYVGGKHRRVRGDAYFELVDEFLTAVRRRYGNSGALAAAAAVSLWGQLEEKSQLRCCSVLIPPCFPPARRIATTKCSADRLRWHGL